MKLSRKQNWTNSSELFSLSLLFVDEKFIETLLKIKVSSLNLKRIKLKFLFQAINRNHNFMSIKHFYLQKNAFNLFGLNC